MESLKLLLKLSFLFLFSSAIVQSSFAATRRTQGDFFSGRRRIPGVIGFKESARADFIKPYFAEKLSSSAKAIKSTEDALELLENYAKELESNLLMLRNKKIEVLHPSLLQKIPFDYRSQTLKDENVADIYTSLDWNQEWDNVINEYININKALKGLYRNKNLLTELLANLQQQQLQSEEESAKIKEELVENLYKKRIDQDDQDEKELADLTPIKKIKFLFETVAKEKAAEIRHGKDPESRHGRLNEEKVQKQSKLSPLPQPPVKPLKAVIAEKAIRPFPIEAGMSGMAWQRPTSPQKSVSIKKFFNKGFPATFFRTAEEQEEFERVAALKNEARVEPEIPPLALSPEERARKEIVKPFIRRPLDPQQLYKREEIIKSFRRNQSSLQPYPIAQSRLKPEIYSIDYFNQKYTP